MKDRDVAFFRTVDDIKAGTGRFSELIGEKGPSPTSATAAFRKSKRILESTQDESNFLPSVFLEAGAAAARAVGRIVVSTARDYKGRLEKGGWKGTGFLVGPNLLMTNHHVLHSRDVCKDAVFQLNYRNRLDGSEDSFDEYRLLPGELFVTSPVADGLDYTFVAVAKEAASRYGSVPLDRRAYVFEEERALRTANIIQHPNGGMQEIVIHDNYIEEDEGTLLYYRTDTEGGSSGSPVFDNHWRLIALHHASREDFTARNGRDYKSINEGIKISAIASDLERRQSEEGGASSAAAVLALFNGINSATGYFGTLGRTTSETGLEALTATYAARSDDVDIGTWNIELFSNDYETKLRRVATLIADFNLDLWALLEAPSGKSKELVKLLKDDFKLDYDVAHSEGEHGKHATAIIWNKVSLEGERVDWPEPVRVWFETQIASFGGVTAGGGDGKVFDRYPGLFRFKVKETGFAFNAVLFHLKNLSEGSLRHEIATKILAAAISRVIEEDGQDEHRDWIVLGDFNSKLVSKYFAGLAKDGLATSTAQDDQHGAIACLRHHASSIIDHVYLSPYAAKRSGGDLFFTLTEDKTYPDYVQAICDHRPVVARLSLRAGSGTDVMNELPGDLSAQLDRLFPPAQGATAKNGAGGAA
jgi:V8-like Glu-specific endopeptidase/endonuclease/exonuclease/phosphatase family metal-dependent hydrolase